MFEYFALADAGRVIPGRLDAALFEARMTILASPPRQIRILTGPNAYELRALPVTECASLAAAVLFRDGLPAELRAAVGRIYRVLRVNGGIVRVTHIG